MKDAVRVNVDGLYGKDVRRKIEDEFTKRIKVIKF